MKFIIASLLFLSFLASIAGESNEQTQIAKHVYLNELNNVARQSYVVLGVLNVNDENASESVRTLKVLEVIKGDIDDDTISIEPNFHFKKALDKSFNTKDEQNINLSRKKTIIGGHDLAFLSPMKPIYVGLEICEFSFNYCVREFVQPETDEKFELVKNILAKYSPKGGELKAINDYISALPKNTREYIFEEETTGVKSIVSGLFIKPSDKEKIYKGRDGVTDCLELEFRVNEVIYGKVASSNFRLGYLKDYAQSSEESMESLMNKKRDLNRKLQQNKFDFVNGTLSKRNYIKIYDDLIKELKPIQTQIRVKDTKLYSNEYILLEKIGSDNKNFDSCANDNRVKYVIWGKEQLIDFQVEVLERLKGEAQKKE